MLTSDITHDLGTFEGFNFRTQSAIERALTACEVVQWDHDREGEAEFWPSGDHPGVALLFKHRSAVTASQILALDRVLGELGDDSIQAVLKIHFAVNIQGRDLAELSGAEVENDAPQIFIGTSFLDVRREAAFELFELYYPDEYRVWEQSHCDGLIFDTDRFLDSPAFSVDEIALADQIALLIAPQ
jgi:hypothetical protein